MGQSWPLFPFIFVFSTRYNSNFLNWKKRRWCAWDSNPGRQDGRRERIHWAMAAPPIEELFMSLLFSFKESNFCRKNNLSRLFSSENASVSIYSSYSNSALILISKTSPIIFFVFNILPFHSPLMYWLENGLQ